MTQLTMSVRATPPSVVFPTGRPAEKIAADYTDEELEWRDKMVARMGAAATEAEARAVAAEIILYHEAKCLLDARNFEPPAPKPKRIVLCSHRSHVGHEWTSEHGRVLCGICHPPAADRVVAARAKAA